MDNIEAVLNLNSPEMRQLAFQSSYIIVTHPLDYARTLMQVGYEPFAPTERNFLGSPYLALPNLFQYVKYLKSVDGFFGCYRGLAPRLCQHAISSIVNRKVASLAPKSVLISSNNGGEGDKGEVKPVSARSGLLRSSQASTDLKTVAKRTGWEIICVSAGVISSHPFYVISVRTMAQFVGRETLYKSLWDSIKQIFNEEGLCGFFSGLTPRLIGDVAYVAISASLVYLINIYVGKNQSMDSITSMASHLVASSCTYQFQVIASTMAVNNIGLAIGRPPHSPVYHNWIDSWLNLKENKQLKRGASILGRYYVGPTIMVGGHKKPIGFLFGPEHPSGMGSKDWTNSRVLPPPTLKSF